MEMGDDTIHARANMRKRKLDETIVEEDTSSNKGNEELHEVTKIRKQELEDHGTQVLEVCKTSAELNTGNNEETLLKEFKEDLKSTYQTHESTIPISPLVENHDVPLEEFYVQPPMMAFDKPHPLSRCQTNDNIYWQKSCKHGTAEQNIDSPAKSEIKSYKGLFFKNDDTPYRNIYLSAQAGMGKTSFSRKLAISWCPAQTLENLPDNDEKKDFKDAVSTVQNFEYLFLLHLRDYQGTGECNVEDMIWRMINIYFIESDKYSKDLLLKILREKRCLVVLDGLDEWSHPERSCTRNERIPHMKAYKMCTTLTLTRPWKMSTIGLNSKQIDRHVEFTNLNENKIYELGNNALNILNKSYNTYKDTTTLHNFLKKVYEAESGDIITIPYVLQQFICMWHDGREIGNSRCEIYGNTIDFTLERGMKKAGLPDLLNLQSEPIIQIPKCMRNATASNSHIYLIFKLGKLAFFSLFNDIKESTLIIDGDTVYKYLDKKEIEFCFKTGLLSQSKDIKIVSKERFTVNFSHKSIQEYFAALYISFTWRREKETEETIRNACKSLRDILEFSSVVIFVCGISCDVYRSLSLELQTVVANDKITVDYRQLGKLSEVEMVSPRKDEMMRALERVFSLECLVPGALWEYQLMHLLCAQENERNENGEVALPLEDYFIVDTDVSIDHLKTLKKVAMCKENKVKSLTVYTYPSKENVIGMLHILKDLRSIESLFWYSKYDDFLSEILAGSASTLASIQIEQVSVSSSVTDSITTLSKLQSIYLCDNVRISHSDTERLCFYLGKTTTVRHIRLNNVCKDHLRNCPGFALDLTKHSKLQKLYLLDLVSLSELHVNGDKLEECEIDACKFSGTASLSFLTEIQGAPVLSSLILSSIKHRLDMLVRIMPTLLQLKSLTLKDIDLGHNVLSLPPTMTKLENLILENVVMSIAVSKDLFSRTIPSLVQLKGLTLTSIDIGDNCLSLPPTMTQFENLTVDTAVMSHSVLKYLVSRTVPSLVQLKSLTLKNIDLGDNILYLPPTMPKLESVNLKSVTMSTSRWKELINSVYRFSQSVTFMFEDCKGPSEKEWKEIETDIRSLKLYWWQEKTSYRGRGNVKCLSIKEPTDESYVIELYITRHAVYFIY